MKSAFLLFSSGQGPEECNLAVKGILDRFLEEADDLGFESDVSTRPGRHGLLSATVGLNGNDIDTFVKSWTGTCMWRCRSPLRPNHGRANWFIGVHKLPPVPELVVVPPNQVRFETTRAGGPGGQHQNTTDSAVRAIWQSPEKKIFSAMSREQRSQHQNKSVAMERLCALVNQSFVQEKSNFQSSVHLSHHALERGNPIRTFKGPNFMSEAPALPARNQDRGIHGRDER